MKRGIGKSFYNRNITVSQRSAGPIGDIETKESLGQETGGNLWPTPDSPV